MIDTRHTHLLVLGYALLGLRELVARSLLGHGVLIVVGGHLGQLSFMAFGLVKMVGWLSVILVGR